jgi:hypothetical protein
LSDPENSRHRAERTAEEARRCANADFARELLAIADNLQRAVTAAEQHTGAARIEGVRAIAPSDESGPGLVPDLNNRHDASHNRDMQSDYDRTRNRRGR